MSSTFTANVRLDARAAAVPSIISVLRRRVAVWLTRAEERRALREMDARMLKDIGVTRYDVAIEAAKPWWRA